MAIFEEFAFDPTAFMSGQMLSKNWLCDHLYDRYIGESPVIWIFGGWYATTNFILRTKNKIKPSSVISFDADEKATLGAKIFNESYIWKGEFNALTVDVDNIRYDGTFGKSPDIIINTSCEHMGMEWFHNIPEGTYVVLQSNNMNHDDHESDMTSLDEMEERYPLGNLDYRDELSFSYETWGFTRYMVMGWK